MSENEQKAGCVDDAVERLAKHFCREEWKDKGLPLDEMMRRLEQWQRFVPEARAALEAAALSPARSGEAVAWQCRTRFKDEHGKWGAWSPWYACQQGEPGRAVDGMCEAEVRALGVIGPVAANLCDDRPHDERGKCPACAPHAVAEIRGIDEYGPMIDWHTHWVDLGVGAKLYAHPAPRNESSGVSPDGSSNCPICGVDTPHPHAPKDITRWIAVQADRFRSVLGVSLGAIQRYDLHEDRDDGLYTSRMVPAESGRYVTYEDHQERLIAATPAPQDSVRVGDGWKFCWSTEGDDSLLLVSHPEHGGVGVWKEPTSERTIPEAMLYLLARDLMKATTPAPAAGADGEDNNG